MALTRVRSSTQRKVYFFSPFRIYLSDDHAVSLARLKIDLPFWIWRQTNGSKKRNASPLGRYSERGGLGCFRTTTNYRRSNDAGARVSQKGRHRAEAFARERTDHLHPRRRFAFLDWQRRSGSDRRARR